MELRIGNAAILAYRRLPYRPWYAIAEFVDNSTDAYYRGENRAVLDETFRRDGERLEVEVVYDKDLGILRVTDNSMGMNEKELEAAMTIAEAPEVTAGRSEFGMGMKTAAIWFAEEIVIRTKKLGEKHELRVEVSVDKFVNQRDSDLRLSKTSKPEGAHYTVIELSNLQRSIGPSAFAKTTEFLGSIYRDDLRNGALKLTVNGQDVQAPPSRKDDVFLQRADGSPYLVDVGPLDIDGRMVTGWIGVLKTGYSSAANAGFALIRNGRAVRGWRDAWRPTEVFGEGRGSLRNQRIAGELYLEGFNATHIKDSIDWEHDEEEILGQEIRRLATEYGLLREADRANRNRADSSETHIEKAEAQDRIRNEMKSATVAAEIRFLDVPEPEFARITSGPLLEAADLEQPILEFSIGKDAKAFLFELDLSPNDPYFEYEILQNADLRIVINARHPANDLLNSAEARVAHYHHVLLDAVAEWKCAQQALPLDPSSIRLMKDRLFRVVSAIEG